MQEYIDKDGWDASVIEPNLLAYYTVDGRSTPCPSTAPLLLYYNKTVFDEAGHRSAHHRGRHHGDRRADN